jgi:hypothetical protein
MARGEKLTQLLSCGDHLLKIVENQEHPLVLQVLLECGDERNVWSFTNVESPGYGKDDRSRISNGCQLDEVHSVGEIFEHLLGHLKREPSLTYAPGPNQCEQTRNVASTVHVQQAAYGFGVALAADKHGRLGEQIRGYPFASAWLSGEDV